MTERQFLADDAVFHAPSGETWVLACDQDGEHVVAAGWPETRAYASDCTLKRVATPESRLKMLRQAAASKGDHGGYSYRRSLAASQLKVQLDG